MFGDWAVRYDARKKAKGDPEQILGGAPVFLDFLIDQLRPALQARYRMSDDMILWGHSGGGMFCAFAALKRPAGFRDDICGSPSLNASNFAIFELEKQLASSRRDLPIGLFLGVGEAEALEGDGISNWGVASSTLRFAEILTIRDYPSLKLGLRVLPEKTHGAAWPAVLDAGLRWLATPRSSDRSALDPTLSTHAQ